MGLAMTIVCASIVSMFVGAVLQVVNGLRLLHKMERTRSTAGLRMMWAQHRALDHFSLTLFWGGFILLAVTVLVLTSLSSP
mgnify:CR=1 FL=1